MIKAIETKLAGCFVIETQKFVDDRGYFVESFQQEKFNELTKTQTQFVQDNMSYSVQNVIRGLHAQQGEFAQAKLVRVLQGSVLDVAVDIRKDSPTFGQHIAIELSEDNQKQLFVPRGFLHGFSVLSESAVFFYKCDNYYNKASEIGCVFNDASLNIHWKIEQGAEIVSQKDLELPCFSEMIQQIEIK